MEPREKLISSLKDLRMLCDPKVRVRVRPRVRVS